MAGGHALQRHGDDAKPGKGAMRLRQGADARVFPGDDLTAEISTATHVLMTAGPSEGRDPVLARLREAFLPSHAT
jgi:hypothetical protein